LAIHYPEADPDAPVPVIGLWEFKSGVYSNLPADIKDKATPQQIFKALFDAFPNITVWRIVAGIFRILKQRSRN